jgi:hypothetical protein
MPASCVSHGFSSCLQSLWGRWRTGSDRSNEGNPRMAPPARAILPTPTITRLYTDIWEFGVTLIQVLHVLFIGSPLGNILHHDPNWQQSKPMQTCRTGILNVSGVGVNPGLENRTEITVMRAWRTLSGALRVF